jgi:iron complex outermembrane receptor protein
MKTINRTILFLAGLAATLFMSPAFAALEELIVTAERREANIQDVPIAVTAITQEKLNVLNIVEGQDLQRYVPTLNMFNNITSPTNLSPSMRGMLQQDASLVTAESPFGIYIDDIYVARLNGNNTTLSDIERVEVLRGPQGTLYGRNTAAGAIKYITRTPGEDAWFNASAGAGNWDQLRVQASGGGPLGAGLAGSLSGQYTEKSGQYTNLRGNNPTDVDSQENLTLRGKLAFLTGLPKFDGDVTISYSDSDTDSLQMPNGKTPNDPFGTGQFTSDDIVLTNGEFTTNTLWQANPLQPSPPFGTKPHAETEQTIVGLRLNYDITDNLTFKSITGYVGLEDYFQTDFNGNSADPSEFFAVQGSADTNSDQFSQEIQFLGTAMDDKINYLAGAFYLNEKADQVFGYNLANIYDFGTGQPIALQAYAPLSRSLIDTETTSYSVFGEASYRTDFGLGGTVGLRYTKDEKDLDFDWQDGMGSPPEPHITEEANSEEWTPRFVLDYEFGTNADVIDSMLVYGSAAKGYKGGGFSAIAIFSTAPVGPYDPETNWTYEVGLKADWIGHKVRTNIDYFFSDISDIQQNSTASTGGGGLEFPVENVGDAQIQGIEFEISAAPLEGLNLFLTGALMDGKYTRLEPGSAGANAPADFGVQAQTPQTPDYSFDIGFDYTYTFAANAIDDISFGADYYKIDEYITAATNDFLNTGWDNINAFVGLNITDNWRVQVTGKNLADKTNVTSGSRGLGGFIYLPPREYLLTVTYTLSLNLLRQFKNRGQTPTGV